MGDDAALVMQRKEHAIGWIAGADVCHVAGLLEALTPYGIHPSMGGEEEDLSTYSLQTVKQIHKDY